jgi:translocation-and-assembly-module (TAM) inner membrane subunit TamB-like protein
MRRQLARSVFILLCGAVATALGVATAMLFTPPGNRLLARLLTDQSGRVIRGSVYIGAVRGGWFRGFALDSVVIRDSSGTLLVSAPHVDVHYQLANLLKGRILLSSARVIRPDIQLLKHRSGRLNYEEIFRLGEGPAGAASLLEIDNLEIVDGRLTIRMPWNPDGRLRTAGQVDSALAYERTKPGRRIEPGPEGLELIRTIDGLNAKVPLLRISTPDRQPVTLQLAQLAARISDPRLEIRDLRGKVLTRADSLLFELDRFELPGTSGQATGRIDWPNDTLLFHFSFRAPQLALADLRFISPNFPDFKGSGRVQATSLSATRTEYDIRELAVGDPGTRVTGRLVAITDVYRGLGFRNLAVLLENLDLEVVRPYLDTLPFYGRVTGRLFASGFFDDMAVTLDWMFQDAKVPGGASNHVGLNGKLRLGGAEGMLFRNALLSQTDLDLRTVRVVSPAVILQGRLGLDGTLNGPLKNVVFNGRVEHRDDGLPASRLSGMVRLDTRGALLGLETDVVLDSLRFDGIRRTFPSLKTRGALGGSVKLAGFLDDVAVDAVVGGELGHVEAHGRATLLSPKWGADSLRLSFTSVDLATLAGSGPTTSIQGTLLATGTIDSAIAPTGQLALRLGASSIREVTLDSATALLRMRDSVIALDTLRAFWAGGRVDGGGTLGWATPKTGSMKFVLNASELSAFDSLALNLSGMVRDTAAGDQPLSGRGSAELTIQGALGSLQLGATTAVDSIRWLGYRGKAVTGRLAWNPGTRLLDAGVAADSLWRRQLMFSKPSGRVQGRPDSLSWVVSGSSRELSKLSAGGRLQDIPGGRLLHADSLNLELLGRNWGLATPLNARLSDALIALDTVRFVTSDGSGSVELAGELPRSGPGELTLTALGVQLRDVYALTQRDTAGIAGTVAVDARLSGTARAPEIRGSATITGPVFGDFQAPLMRAAFDYRTQLLRGNLTFWRTGKPVVEADISVPLDLALQQVPKRQLPGPLNIVVHGDSIDLALAEAFTPNLRQVSGLLNVDAHIEGTWEAPRLAGQAFLIEGAAYVPGLGVRYQSINGTLRLAQDSILAEGLRIQTSAGSLELSGGVRLERLTSPVLNLSMAARNFELIDVNDYLTLRSSGNVQLTGTLLHPVLTGRGNLTNSVIYFADLVQKEIVNLEDPLFADLADTLALRKYSLGANFQSRFLDSLRVVDLQFEIGEGVWLRSNEANFQLEGRLLVNKTRQLYRIDGTLDVPRGTYTLKAGAIINRTFTVERGTVRYFGDLNAELDVEARHLVRTPENAQDIPVIVHITGTLLTPQLALSTAADRTPMSEAQLITLLAFGTSNIQGSRLFGNTGQTGYAGAAFFTTALSSELQRALISDLGLKVNTIEIRPPLATSGFIGGGTLTPFQLAVGKALTEKLFVTANAGFCLGSSQGAFSPQNLGASLEYRFRRSLQARLTAEPIQTCLVSGVNIFGATRRYQFGAELRWDRDY